MNKNYELIIRGNRKEWVAINTFFIEDWYEMNQNEFAAAMRSKISFLQESYNKLLPSALSLQVYITFVSNITYKFSDNLCNKNLILLQL